MARKPKIERFNENVLSKFQIYNSLFLTLPFDSIRNTSVLIPLFADHCKNGYDQKLDPREITSSFFNRYLPEYDEKEQIDLLFRFIQYIERQVVLFDAIEDAAFGFVNNMHGRGTIRHIKEDASDNLKVDELKDYINRFKVRIVLTAHPTQFYPGSVLGIINDLAKAIDAGALETVKLLLTQLGKTKFYKKTKPSPYDEAVSLIWYLENVFYHSASTIYTYIKRHIFNKAALDNSIFDFGFWPGGDRDGNPYVTPEITLKTAESLKFSILRNYFREVRKMKRSLTFNGLEERLDTLESDLYATLFSKDKPDYFNIDYFEKALDEIHQVIVNQTDGLYESLILDLKHKVKIFGFHFASLDIRQDSRIHKQVFDEIFSHPDIRKYVEGLPENFDELDTPSRHHVLTTLKGDVPAEIFETTITKETLGSIRAMRVIQQRNGERGCNRYIISNCQTIDNILELFALHKICNWDQPTVDIIPLFETIPDLKVCEKIMQTLYENDQYRKHLSSRGDKQTVMLGFSDGTKDGGYFMANWSIYKAKEDLTALSNSYGINVAFFDGRGGPPARGGGNTHEFYASMGKKIQADDIQLTIQGQTISSNFGTNDSCQYNLEQLLSSGIQNQVFNSERNVLSDENRETMNQLADHSHQAYQEFKARPEFIPYLEEMTTLKYYAKANIGSRPSKRGSSKKLDFSDLRAIPFVGSWSQSKQNVPGFYGVGTALKSFEDQNQFEKVTRLYKQSSFFRTLIANSMMSLTKSFFALTAYMQNDKRFGDFWNLIHNEFILTREMILKLTGFEELMENEPAGKASIKVREEIVQPLLTIQQSALMTILDAKKSGDMSEETMELYEKMVTRSLFGNINASRNSA
ncbi:MAG: phosphoenolpyruvate carboxylase [Flavobacteriaceae bacterium]|nr:phosphoenolpyruvate carboxylase [Flavobacteriaceae bacterium]